MEKLIKEIRFDAHGLVPAVIQDHKTEKVLTLCYLNKEALQKTLEEGVVYVFRRSQNRLMKKGETSGHTQAVKEIYLDCEGKSLLLKVEQKVAACHAGYFTCYYRRAGDDGTPVIIEERVFDPKKVY